MTFSRIAQHLADRITFRDDSIIEVAGRQFQFRLGEQALTGSLDSLRFLGLFFYETLYCNKRPVHPSQLLNMTDREYLSALSMANVGQGCWDPHWLLLGRDESYARVSKHGVRFRIPLSGLVAIEQTDNQTTCCVRIPKELQYLLPGFYAAHGNEGTPQMRYVGRQIIRIYWNLTPTIAIEYIDLTTRILNAAKIPFLTKVISHPGGFGRSDAAILYVGRNELDAAIDSCRKVYEGIAHGLRDDIPLFTLPMQPGLALAQDPGNGESFGLHRSGLLSRAVIRSLQTSDRRESLVAHIDEAFARAGIDPDKPYCYRGEDPAIGW